MKYQYLIKINFLISLDQEKNLIYYLKLLKIHILMNLLIQQIRLIKILQKKKISNCVY